MKSINYQVVPSTIEEDYNSSRTVWNGGKIQSMDEGSYVTMFIGHKTVKTIDEEGVEQNTTEAFPVRVQKPYSIDKAVMAGVMSAYGLTTSQDYAALSEEINETNAGTKEDPIPYNNNMELFEGKYYSQNSITYKCTRNTEQAVYQDLSGLVGIYVEVAN